MNAYSCDGNGTCRDESPDKLNTPRRPMVAPSYTVGRKDMSRQGKQRLHVNA